jgi:hypothetical protein
MHDILTLLTGGLNMKPDDISSTLPRQETNSYELRKYSDIKRIVVHTTDWDTDPKTVAAYDIRPYTIYKGEKIWNHISKEGCPAITYHEIIMKDKIYKTLDWKEISWHAGVWNKGSLGVAMMYRCTQIGTTDHAAPSENMTKLTQSRCGDICLELKLTPNKVLGHRELKGTGWYWSKGSKRLRKTCPGKEVDMNDLRYNIARYMQVKLLLAKLYNGEIDGDFGPKSKAALAAYQS